MSMQKPSGGGLSLGGAELGAPASAGAAHLDIEGLNELPWLDCGGDDGVDNLELLEFFPGFDAIDLGVQGVARTPREILHATRSSTHVSLFDEFVSHDFLDVHTDAAAALPATLTPLHPPPPRIISEMVQPPSSARSTAPLVRVPAGRGGSRDGAPLTARPRCLQVNLVAAAAVSSSSPSTSSPGTNAPTTPSPNHLVSSGVDRGARRRTPTERRRNFSAVPRPAASSFRPYPQPTAAGRSMTAVGMVIIWPRPMRRR